MTKNDYYFTDPSTNKVYKIRAVRETEAWRKYIDRFKLLFGRTYSEAIEDLKSDIIIVNGFEVIH